MRNRWYRSRKRRRTIDKQPCFGAHAIDQDFPFPFLRMRSISVVQACERKVVEGKNEVPFVWRAKASTSRVGTWEGMRETLLRKGWSQDADVGFQDETYYRCLRSIGMGTSLLVFREIESTQGFVQDHHDVLPEGCFVVALSQLRGRGRGTNQWTSPRGSLSFSFVRALRVEGRTLPFVQYVVSLAVVKGARQALLDAGSTFEGISRVRIKWPNDVYVDDRKAGGVLCSSTYREGSYVLYCGVGLNVHNREPGACLSELLEKSGMGTDGLVLERVLARIGNELEDLFRTFERDGFAPLESTYLETWMHNGQAVEVVDPKTPRKRSVAIVGLTEDGFLRAWDEEGGACELHPDGNRFDFLQGLIRKRKA